jgi:predicted nucleic acid-binding protein
MIYLLDTDTCSAHMRRPAKLAHRFIQYTGQLAIPAVVLGELYAGTDHALDLVPLLEKGSYHSIG